MTADGALPRQPGQSALRADSGSSTPEATPVDRPSDVSSGHPTAVGQMRMPHRGTLIRSGVADTLTRRATRCHDRNGRYRPGDAAQNGCACSLRQRHVVGCGISGG